jgi:hypothetical protein
MGEISPNLVALLASLKNSFDLKGGNSISGEITARHCQSFSYENNAQGPML